MSDTAAKSGPMLAADGTPLKRSLARALRVQKLRALALVAPLLIFVLVTFIAPIADMLFRSVENQIVAETLPKTVVALESWDPHSTEAPGEDVFAALAADLQVAVAEKVHTRLGSRLNYEISGSASLLRKTGRSVQKWDLVEDAPFKEKFLKIDKDWGDVELWRSLKTYSSRYTSGYFLNAVDMKKGIDGPEARPESEQIYLLLFKRTMFMSLVITGSCILLGYPVAWLLANLPTRTANLLMILVLLPFWTSLLVRTTAWIAMLQSEGVVNDILVAIGLTSDDSRIQLIYNQTGTIVAMTHILLPFMILPLYSVMKTIPPSLMRAARSLGADSFTAFRRVYFPQTVPGIAAGTLLVFILSIGFYITPALVGGQDGQMISNLIAFHMQKSLNWSMAAALGGLLLASVLILYWLYNKLVGVDNLKFG